MEESQEILLKSVESYGISIPPSVSSIAELTPNDLVSICAQCLNLLDDAASFPTSLPSDSVADRVRICTDIASAIKNLGYVGDISFHQFLYPSQEYLYKLIRFLAERISESSESGRIAGQKNISARSKLRQDVVRSSLEDSIEKTDDEVAVGDFSTVGSKLYDLRLEMQAPETSSPNTDAFINQDNTFPVVPKETNIIAPPDASSSILAGFSKDELTCVSNERDLFEGGIDAGRNSFENCETAGSINNGDMTVLKQKIRCETDKVQHQRKVLMDEVTARTSELEHLEQELELMKAAAEMALDDKHSVDFYLSQFSEQLQAKRHHLLKLESDWDALRNPLEERKGSLEESLFSNNPDAGEMLRKLREVEKVEQFILSEIRKSDEEHSKVTLDLEKQPKLASRKSYVQRIMEITKNSRKQDADIERILKEIRDLRLESNSIQERLHRTYAVADEMVFREAKKDPTGRQVHRLLTSIHESFEQVSEKILETDRIRREVAEYEMKLAAITSRSFDVDKLQTDLDAIARENEYLEQKLQDK
ncbi:hypothetical protein L6164_030974 [Bauhinia variegata]|uniref:Uncharacterized protein n=1 Tax=Bauhinia variegata TaxID=167791 RepID=A0ACB9LEW3_BAUVA|nr:hypothetical protein L6164_030974 [Bauhinia variegata]